MLRTHNMSNSSWCFTVSVVDLYDVLLFKLLFSFTLSLLKLLKLLLYLLFLPAQLVLDYLPVKLTFMRIVSMRLSIRDEFFYQVMFRFLSVWDKFFLKICSGITNNFNFLQLLYLLLFWLFFLKSWQRIAGILKLLLFVVFNSPWLLASLFDQKLDFICEIVLLLFFYLWMLNGLSWF